MKEESGSPSTGEPEFLVAGILRRPHGTRGEMLMEIVTDFPERLRRGTRVYIGEDHRPFTIRACSPHTHGMVIGFQELDTPEAVGLYRNQSVSVRSADRPPLPPGRYYYHELLGCEVIDEAAGSIGTLTEILRTGANDVYVITSTNGHEVLLPSIPGVILAVDSRNRRLTVHVPAGMEEGIAKKRGPHGAEWGDQRGSSDTEHGG